MTDYNSHGNQAQLGNESSVLTGPEADVTTAAESNTEKNEAKQPAQEMHKTEECPEFSGKLPKMTDYSSHGNQAQQGSESSVLSGSEGDVSTVAESNTEKNEAKQPAQGMHKTEGCPEFSGKLPKMTDYNSHENQIQLGNESSELSGPEGDVSTVAESNTEKNEAKQPAQGMHKTEGYPEDTLEKNIKSRAINPKLQAEFLQALIDDRFDEFVVLLNHPNVKLNYDYSKPKYSETGTCLEIASRIQGRSEYVRKLLEFGAEPNVNNVVPEPIHYAAKHGNPETLKVLLDDFRTVKNAVDKDGRSALHYAVTNFNIECKENYAECIKLLLECPEFDINKPSKKGYTAIHEAAGNCKEVTELILKQKTQYLDLDTNRVKGRSAREYISDNYPDLRDLLSDIKRIRQLTRLETQLRRALLNRNITEFSRILQLIDTDGNARVDPDTFYGNSTCLEIACSEEDDVFAEFVKTLLDVGADPNRISSTTKKSPLHAALAEGNYNTSIILLREDRTNVKLVDGDGKSALHIIAEWTEMEERQNAISILNIILKKIEHRINLHDKDGQTAAEIALRNNNKEFLEVMLTEAGRFMDLDAVVQTENKTLRECICSRYPDLEEKFPVSRHTVSGDLVLILFDHLYNGRTDEFMQVLQARNENVNIDGDDGNRTLLQYAVLNDLEEPVRELLKANVNPNKITQTEKCPPLIIASKGKKKRILNILIETKSREKLDVNITDIAGNTAVYYASKNRDLESVVALLRRGANIRQKNLFGKSHLSADSIKFFLDEGLKTNGKLPNDENYEMIFDYKLLLAYREKAPIFDKYSDEQQPLTNRLEANVRNPLQFEKFPPEIDFLHHISKSHEYRNIMEHPIVTSFLHVKWLRFKYIYYADLIIFLAFVLFLNTHITLKIGDDDTSTGIFNIAGICFLWLFLMYFFILEIIQFNSSPKTYFKNIVNILDLILIFVTAFLSILNYTQPSLVVIVILTSWTELMLMTPSLRRFSSNIAMLKAVIANYFQLLMSFSSLLIAFGLSLYSVYHAAAKEEQKMNRNSTENEEKLQFFSSPPLSILKTVIMMMGEFEANNLLISMVNNEIGIPLFVSFIFIIPMVLLNLLTGVAVGDTQTIKAQDHIICLLSRIEMIYDIENNMLFLYKTIQAKSRIPSLSVPFLSIIEAILKYTNIFSGTAPGKQFICIRPNITKNFIIDHRDNNTKSKLDSKILRKALEIISQRYEENVDE